MRRGDIYLVDFEPTQGAEADKRRPAVIVSNEGTNQRVIELGWGVIDVVPLTSNVTQIHPFQTLLTIDDSGLTRASKAQAEQVRAVSLGRIERYVGHLSGAAMRAVDDALRRQLAL